MINRKRVFVVLAGLFLAYGVVGLRLGVIQLGAHGDLAAAVSAQNSVEVSLEAHPRGQILDRNGVSLLASESVDRAVVIPHYIEDKYEMARRLAEIVKADAADVRARLEEPGVLPYTLTETQGAAIREMDENGVLVLSVHLRYGEDALAPHVTGHLGKISSMDELERIEAETGGNYRISDWVGKSGIEAYYEGFLRGERPVAVVRSYRDARLSPLPGLDAVVEQDDNQRGDVFLTLDAEIQRVAEEVMAGVDSGALVVSDVRTGDILALVSSPDYSASDPIASAVAIEGNAFYNRATALYQPGSVFKIVLTATALEIGAVTIDAVYECAGGDDGLVTCWYEEGHGEISLMDAFAHSCNPYFGRLGLEIGADELVRFADRFGFSDQTILGYPIKPDHRQDLSLIKGPFSLINASIGQGPVLVSPVQVNALTAAIANDGWYNTPRLVDRVENQKGERLLTVCRPKPRRVMSEQTAAVMKDLLASATTDGQGKEAYLNGYGSAGKTGSAQVGDTGKVNAWFTGYFPLQTPRYALTVLVEDGVSGGLSAAPLFREAAAGILRTAE